MSKKDKIIYKELSYKIVGCFYKVYNTLGPGHKESVYQKAISIEFDKQKIHSQQQETIQLKYEGEKVGVYEPDFIVEGKIIVEIKSTINMPKVFEKQLYYYLKATDYRLGYLVNFGTSEIDIRRCVL